METLGALKVDSCLVVGNNQLYTQALLGIAINANGLYLNPKLQDFLLAIKLDDVCQIADFSVPIEMETDERFDALLLVNQYRPCGEKMVMKILDAAINLTSRYVLIIEEKLSREGLQTLEAIVASSDFFTNQELNWLLVATLEKVFPQCTAYLLFKRQIYETFCNFNISFYCIVCQRTAARRKIMLSGRVYDAFTEMYVPNTKITLLYSDSTVIDTSRVGVNRLNNASLTTYYLIYAPAHVGKYIVKLENPYYKTCFLDIEIKRLGRRTGVKGPDAKMQILRKTGGLHGENELGEIVVKATKVQFFYKGDTIVYNADAFNLPEGSMLDALVRQMPGAKLTEDGEIYINEKKVDYLTLNGKKMFDGNGQILLQNLPHYAVKELKVFERNKEHQIGTGIESLQKDYVLDVALKREYDGNNFGQVELGVGTKGRRLGHLFDSYNRESLQMMGYANLNNVNQTREPGQDGSFSESDGPRSIVENKQFGMSISKEKAHGDFSNVLSVTGAIRNSDTDFQRLEQTHLLSSEVTKSTTSQQHNRVSSFQARNRLILKAFLLQLHYKRLLQ